MLFLYLLIINCPERPNLLAVSFSNPSWAHESSVIGSIIVISYCSTYVYAHCISDRRPNWETKRGANRTTD